MNITEGKIEPSLIKLKEVKDEKMVWSIRIVVACIGYAWVG
ncbi:MAG: hypothetical protein ACQEQO_05975 [Thermodesulfobacteriota bacterium]